jgi:hypothetical protein
LGVAGSACLLLALLPNYSNTAAPNARSGVPTIELAKVGTLPLEPSKTVLRVGLPFSPLFVYQTETTFEPQPASAPASANGGASEPGGAVSSDEVKIDFTGEIGFTRNWHLGFLSWSSALTLLGIGLLVITFWNLRNRSRTRPDVVGGG